MARDYYNLPANATFRDVILSVRADESIHREVNHFVTDLDGEEPAEAEEVFILKREEALISQNQHQIAAD
jgi:ubiquinol oxidase